ncbi:MAG: serine/threonine-protein phosphatase [Prevotella sp.]|nr:serine/threonine-protein phosphatase [Prevotella sp.]
MNAIKTAMPFAGYWDTRQGGRPENQDSCGFLDTDKGLIAVVCDGMGGGPGGRLASTIAVQKIVEYVVNAPQEMPRTEMVANAIEYGHQCILAKTAETPALRGMGSTATVVLINKQSAILGHVGDSRIYQFRRGKKIFRTADHSMVGELVRNGTLTEEQARLSSQSNIITKALGSKLINLAEVTERPYDKGDRFMLCTDGIWGSMPEKDLIRRVAKTASLSGAVDSTVIEVDEIGRANGNKHDNLTIALLETKQDSLLKEKMSKKTLHILLALAAICLLSVILNIVLICQKKPAANSEELESLLVENDARGQRIRALEDSISALWGNVASSKQEAADATMKVAKEKESAAEKAKSEAEQKAKEAQAAAEQAQNAAKQAQAAADAIQKSRSGIISQLTKIKDMQENAQRKQLRSTVSEQLKTLAEKDAKNKAAYDEVRARLADKIAADNPDNSKGHYNILIKKLQSLK